MGYGSHVMIECIGRDGYATHNDDRRIPGRWPTELRHFIRQCAQLKKGMTQDSGYGIQSQHSAQDAPNTPGFRSGWGLNGYNLLPPLLAFRC